jgi:predicted acylesterase/phospholipase RssA
MDVKVKAKVKVKYIVFSSGAMGGLAHIGAWKAIEESNLNLKIKGMSGCSMGSVIATLASIGFSAREMELIALKFRYDDYSDLQLRLLYNKFGLETGDKLMKLLEKLIKWKTNKRNLTFLDHWVLTGRQLWINAACIEDQKCKYYSVFTTPNMKIVSAIRRSISVPYLFSAVRTKKKTYIDGGCYDPVPAKMFLPELTICLNVRNNKVKINTDKSSKLSLNILSFSSILFGGMFTQLNMLRFARQEQDNWKMIYIYTGIDSVKFSLEDTEIQRVIDIGYNAVKVELF